MIPDKWYLSKLYQLISKSPRTTKEIREWLKKRKAQPEQVETIVQKLLELELLNDTTYTHSYIRTQILIKHQSARQLIFKLQKKGIKSELVRDVLEEEGHDEVGSARYELQKQRWRWTSFEPKERLQKQREFLARKGFSFDVIKKAESDE